MRSERSPIFRDEKVRGSVKGITPLRVTGRVVTGQTISYFCPSFLVPAGAAGHAPFALALAIWLRRIRRTQNAVLTDGWHNGGDGAIRRILQRKWESPRFRHSNSRARSTFDRTTHRMERCELAPSPQARPALSNRALFVVPPAANTPSRAR